MMKAIVYKILCFMTVIGVSISVQALDDMREGYPPGIAIRVDKVDAGSYTIAVAGGTSWTVKRDAYIRNLNGEKIYLFQVKVDTPVLLVIDDASDVVTEIWQLPANTPELDK